MAQQGVSYQDAYLVLRSVSQHNNRKLRDVAAAILAGHELSGRQTGIA